jgi:hypothetical protein
VSEPILLSAEVGEALKPRLTVGGILEMLADMRASGEPMPAAILLSEYDRRELNQDLCAGAAQTLEDAKRDRHDGDAIAIIGGVPVFSHRDVRRGTARLVYAGQQKH